MNSIMIISKTNMSANQGYYSQILTTWFTILKLKMFMTILIRIKKSLILVNVDSNALDDVKMKDELGGIAIPGSARLRPTILESSEEF